MMKNCRYTRYHRVLKWATLSVELTAIALLVICGIYSLVDSIKNQQLILGMITATLCIAISLWLGMLSLRIFRFENRKFSISNEGIYVSHSDKKFYSWCDVRGVGVFGFAANAMGDVYETVLCVFLEDMNADMLKKIFRGYTYATKKLSSFVIIDYSEKLLEQMETYSNLEVLDYRNDQLKM